MRYLPDGSLQYSPRDLVAYLDGDFAAWCERFEAERHRGSVVPSGNNPLVQPDERAEDLALAARKGLEHEARYLAGARANEPRLVEIGRGDADTAETAAALRAGAPIVYQGHLSHADWHGYPDFLGRVSGASRLGDYHYEPWDTKLARSAKPYFLVQLCAYADLLESIQGTRPASIRFILGNCEERSFPTDEYFFYYLQLKESFLRFQATWTPDSMPDPGLERTHGRWSEAADQILEKSDHLSRVAGIARGQIRRLEEASIPTLTALATTTIPRVPNVGMPVFERLRLQAALQIRSKGTSSPAYEVRVPSPEDPRRGLALLPPPSSRDVFFDMEGFPFAEEGLEYLFGVSCPEPEGRAFRDWWAHDQAEEKLAFEGFIDWVYRRWQDDPTMHIYHYASYEKSAICRLMGKYATRELEVDNLLRSDVLVDLFTVVRQGLVIGTPSYSLKDIERLYMGPRTEEVTSAGGSVVEYQRWTDSGEPRQWQESPILSAIRAYNRVDCDSTWQLRDWLLARQGESEIPYIPAPATGGSAVEAPQEPSEAETLAAGLLLKAEREGDPELRRVTELLGWLVEFHRREEKPMWWRMFERLEMTNEELQDDIDCLSGLVRTDVPPRPEKRSSALEYQFDPDQDTKLHEGSKCAIAGTDGKAKFEIIAMDRDAGLLELKVGPGKALPDRLSLLPDEFVSAAAIKAAILRFATEWSNGRVLSQAVDDLLFRRSPRIEGHSGGPLLTDAKAFLPQVVALATRLNGTTLSIQGPPGTGKTFTAAAIIAELLRQGKRLGIAANSHKVILNLMRAIVNAKRDSGAPGTLYKVGNVEEEANDPLIVDQDVTHMDSAGVVNVLGDPSIVVGGTAWVFTRPELEGRFDYLFIDEAGQVSLANAVAMGLSATNLILIGDQMQLGQPTQGAHPGETGLSCLEYALHGHTTIPTDLGVFLGTSFRMHPAVCEFISDAIYEGRLRSDPKTANHRIIASGVGGIRREAGIVFVPVAHEGCTQSSEEEVEIIDGLVQELLGRQVVGEDGVPRRMTHSDILLVAPFNMQVRLLRSRLGGTIRVGSVDKFQGQEAPVVIVSMCASSIEEAPRGAEFLLSRNRLNVAVSRAQALAIVVGSPTLMAARCRTVHELQLVNLLCRLRYYSLAAET